MDDFKFLVEKTKIMKEWMRILDCFGGYLLIRSKYIDGVVAFVINRNMAKAFLKKGYVCFLPDEVAEIVLKKVTPEGLKKIYETKKIFGGKIVNG